MAINLDKINEEIERLNQPKGAGAGVKNENWFKPVEGTQTIRFLPDAEGDPFKKMVLHYDIPNHKQGLICLKGQYGERCPVCDFASKLWKIELDPPQKNEEGFPVRTAEQQIAKKLFNKEKYYAAIVSRKEGEEMKSKWLAFNKENYLTLLTLVRDPDYGDITDVKDGRDFTLTYTVPKKKGTYPSTSLTVGGKQKPLAGSKKEIDAILATIKPLSELMASQVKTKAELEEILKTEFAFDEDGHTSLGGSGNSSGPEDTEKSVDDMFNEIQDA